MKKLETILIICFGISVLGRFTKIPYHTILMAVSAVAFTVTQLVGVAKSEEKRNNFLLGLATGSWMLFFTTKIKFLSISEWLLTIAVLLTAIAIGKNIKIAQKEFSVKIIILIIMLLGSTAISLLPSHELYYWSSIRFNRHLGVDYQALDKYSWMLSINNAYDEALAFNSLAMDAAQNAVNQDIAPKDALFEIADHKILIQQRSWQAYP